MARNVPPLYWAIAVILTLFFLYNISSPRATTRSLPIGRDEASFAEGEATQANICKVPKGVPENYEAEGEATQAKTCKVPKGVPENYETVVKEATQMIAAARKARGLAVPDIHSPVSAGLMRKIKYITPTDVHGYPGGDVITTVQTTGVWAHEETQVMDEILRNGCAPDANGLPGLMIDVGSQMGYFSMQGIAHGCDVLAVEPYRESTSWLRLSLAYNKIPTHRWRIFENLCTDVEPENVQFNGWNAAHANEETVETIGKTKTDDVAFSTVPVTLDTAVAQMTPRGCVTPDEAGLREVAFMKMDIEGHEPHCFYSAAKLFAHRRIRYILFEITHWLFHVRTPLVDTMLDNLQHAGYELQFIQGTTIYDLPAEKASTWIRGKIATCDAQDPKPLYSQLNMLARQKGLPRITGGVTAGDPEFWKTDMQSCP